MAELSGLLYQCSAGETFDKIALNIYESEKYAAELMNANPDYVHLAVFTGEEVLSLPVIEKTGGQSAYVQATAPWKR